jgi:hypothetical protein
MELITRQLSLEHVEVMSAFDGAARPKAERQAPGQKNAAPPGCLLCGRL